VVRFVIIQWLRARIAKRVAAIIVVVLVVGAAAERVVDGVLMFRRLRVRTAATAAA
jgi:hypothetical protein